MLNPFPGMNPYLEHPELWHQVHNRLIVGIADAIAHQIAPHYRVAIEQRIYQSFDDPQNLVGIADKERYLEIREVATKELIMVIEILSPANKRSGEGRSLYEAKRTKILITLTHLIEIDLLRSGKPMAMTGAGESDYRILVSRSGDRPHADLFRFDLQQPIPNFPVPLRPESTEAMVDLQSVLNEVYQRARFDLSIDYSGDPVPKVDEKDLFWMRELISP